jgi:hypothetical protein
MVKLFSTTISVSAFLSFISFASSLMPNNIFINRISRTKLFCLDNCKEYDNWNSGEVSWDYNPNTQYNSDISYVKPDNNNNNNNNISNNNNNNNNNNKNNISNNNNKNKNDNYESPLQIKIRDGQNQMASVSAIVKTSYKELFNLDTLFSEFHNNINSKLAIFMPTELFILTLLYGVAVIYNKTTEIETRRLSQLYKFNEQSQYFKKYLQVRKITMMLFIITTVIFTKNIQIVE